MIEEDVPSPIDLRQMADARPWAELALVRRPVRTEFFAAFAREIAQAGGGAGHPAPARVLELGSGPGFLAQTLLGELPAIRWVALDFSPAMHELARERLAPHAGRVEFVERSFLEPGWPRDLGRFDFAVTHQAVHELRHKRRAGPLHRQVRDTLAPGGTYLVCDHFVGDGGMTDGRLYMTIAEHRQALEDAGFAQIEPVLVKAGLVLHRAR